MENFINLVNKMDTTYEMASGSAHFQGKKVDEELVQVFKSLSDEDKLLVAKHFEPEFETRLNWTYVGYRMKEFLKWR